MDAKLFYAKDVFKTAVKVGAGLAIGKYLGDVITSGVIEGIARGFLKHNAKKGNKFSQEFCDKNNIEYEGTEASEEEPKIKMGFTN